MTPRGDEYVVGTGINTAPILAGESAQVSVMWDTSVNTTEGGLLQVRHANNNHT